MLGGFDRKPSGRVMSLLTESLFSLLLGQRQRERDFVFQELAQKIEVFDIFYLKEIFRSSVHLIIQVICEFLCKLCTTSLNNGLVATY